MNPRHFVAKIVHSLDPKKRINFPKKNRFFFEPHVSVAIKVIQQAELRSTESFWKFQRWHGWLAALQQFTSFHSVLHLSLVLFSYRNVNALRTFTEPNSRQPFFLEICYKIVLITTSTLRDTFPIRVPSQPKVLPWIMILELNQKIASRSICHKVEYGVCCHRCPFIVRHQHWCAHFEPIRHRSF